MSELGTFLERFYGPKPTFRTVRAVVRHTTYNAPEGPRKLRRRPIGRAKDNVNRDSAWEEMLRIWWRLPDNVRVESTREMDDVSKTAIEVVNPQDSWKRHFDGTLESGPRNRRRKKIDLPTELQRHFDRIFLRQCFAALTLESLGTADVVNRTCLKVRAVPIPGEQLWPHWLPAEAEEFEFAMDVEQVALLSLVGTAGGHPIESYQVEEVEFDEEFDDSVFVYQATHEEVVIPAAPIFEKLSFEAAASRASFAVLKPGHLGRDRPVGNEVMYHPARPDSRLDALTVHCTRSNEDETLWLTQRKQRDPRHEDYVWESFMDSDQSFELSDPNPEDKGLRILRFARSGTHVDIFSDLPTEEMVKIALTLTPVEVDRFGP